LALAGCAHAWLDMSARVARAIKHISVLPFECVLAFEWNWLFYIMLDYSNQQGWVNYQFFLYNWPLYSIISYAICATFELWYIKLAIAGFYVSTSICDSSLVSHSQKIFEIQISTQHMDGSNCFGVVMFKCDIFLLKPSGRNKCCLLKYNILSYKDSQTPVEYTHNK
jgi:hypothetical protein